jgi:hypothetical protein
VGEKIRQKKEEKEVDVQLVRTITGLPKEVLFYAWLLLYRNWQILLNILRTLLLSDQLGLCSMKAWQHI